MKTTPFRIRPLAVATFFLIAACLPAQENWSVSLIPPALLENAKMVVRHYSLQFDVENEGKAQSIEEKAFTLLSPDVADRAELAFYYDSFNDLIDIEAAVYDASGNLVKRLQKKDISDVKPPEKYVQDYRLKVLRLPARAYPYTIWYRVTYRKNGLLFYPTFKPQEATYESVQKAAFQVNMPAGMSLRALEKNMPEQFNREKNTWTFQNIPAIKPRAYAPPKPLPVVISAPETFTFDGYSGKMDSWNHLGGFFYQLLQNRQELPPEVVYDIQQKVADCTDIPCKVERVYQYLQDNTRYFYVGMGIGGWQPERAAKTHQYKYGDCKGLSNYMVSLLRAVDVPACYVLIRAGAGEWQEQYPDFPNPSFNHAIACVPLPTDTIWLECTSQTESTGFLSDFTDRRMALLVTPEGGYVAQTPVYDERHNQTDYHIQLTLAEDGSAQLSATNRYRAIEQRVRAYLARENEETQQKWLYKQLEINSFTLNRYQLLSKKGVLPEVEEQIDLSLSRFASVSGKRLFVPVSTLVPSVYLPVNTQAGNLPVQADERGFTRRAITDLTFPEGYHLESAPEAIMLETDFGKFQFSVVQTPDHQVQITRVLLLNSDVLPAAKWADLRQFLKEINRADKTKLVLVKGT